MDDPDENGFCLHNGNDAADVFDHCDAEMNFDENTNRIVDVHFDDGDMSERTTLNLTNIPLYDEPPPSREPTSSTDTGNVVGETQNPMTRALSTATLKNECQPSNPSNRTKALAKKKRRRRYLDEWDSDADVDEPEQESLNDKDSSVANRKRRKRSDPSTRIRTSELTLDCLLQHDWFLGFVEGVLAKKDSLHLGKGAYMRRHKKRVDTDLAFKTQAEIFDEIVAETGATIAYSQFTPALMHQLALEAVDRLRIYVDHERPVAQVDFYVATALVKYGGHLARHHKHLPIHDDANRVLLHFWMDDGGDTEGADETDDDSFGDGAMVRCGSFKIPASSPKKMFYLRSPEQQKQYNAQLQTICQLEEELQELKKHATSMELTKLEMICQLEKELQELEKCTTPTEPTKLQLLNAELLKGNTSST